VTAPTSFTAPADRLHHASVLGRRQERRLRCLGTFDKQADRAALRQPMEIERAG
jgi:hypothetical protein